MPITRTLSLSDITPLEMATFFADLCDIDQAEFFHHLHALSRDWPNSGWCGQACNIAARLTPEGRSVVRALGEHAA